MSAQNRVKISNVNAKCDRNLSQESIRKAPYFECFFLISQQITGIWFCSSWSRGISEKS